MFLILNCSQTFDTQADEKLQNRLDYFQIQMTANEWDRVSVISGDLGEEKFGISSSLYDELAKKATAIFHCGAVVNHVLPYTFHKGANVIGTQEVFCTHVHLFFVSSFFYFHTQIVLMN